MNLLRFMTAFAIAAALCASTCGIAAEQSRMTSPGCMPSRQRRQARWLASCIRGAQAGDGRAALTVGQIYWNGDGVTKDNSEAAHWWRMADPDGAFRSCEILGRRSLRPCCCIGKRPTNRHRPRNSGRSHPLVSEGTPWPETNPTARREASHGSSRPAHEIQGAATTSVGGRQRPIDSEDESTRHFLKGVPDRNVLTVVLGIVSTLVLLLVAGAIVKSPGASSHADTMHALQSRAWFNALMGVTTVLYFVVADMCRRGSLKVITASQWRTVATVVTVVNIYEATRTASGLDNSELLAAVSWAAPVFAAGGAYLRLMQLRHRQETNQSAAVPNNQGAMTMFGDLSLAVLSLLAAIIAFSRC